jgi:hypothetical protein
LALVAELEQAREQLGKARQTMLWVGSYGTPAASSSIPSGSLIAGLAGPTRRIFGLEQQLSAEAIFRGLREDANVLRTIGTPEQLEALGKRVRKREAQWQEGNPDFVGPRFDAAWAGSPEEAAAAERVNRYAEAVRKRLWGE